MLKSIFFDPLSALQHICSVINLEDDVGGVFDEVSEGAHNLDSIQLTTIYNICVVLAFCCL